MKATVADAWRSRRWRTPTFVAVVALLCGGAFIAWRMTHQRDPRLVGRWRLTQHVSPLHDASGRSGGARSPGAGVEWCFSADGTGTHGHGSRIDVPFRWRADGDRLLLKWGPFGPSQGIVREMLDELVAKLRGRALEGQYEEFTYTVAAGNTEPGRQIVLQSQDGWHPPPDDVFDLTWIGEAGE